MIEYEYFYRKYGVRKPDHLVNPIMTKVGQFQFPKSSIYHYTGGTLNETGPSSNDVMFKGINKGIFLDHVLKLSLTKGEPRYIPIDVNGLVRKHRVRNKTFRQLTDFDNAARDTSALIVYSYCLLPNLYRYTKTIFSEYYRWYNEEATLWNKVAEIASFSDRNQFIKIDLPDVLPSLTELTIGSGALNQKVLKLFPTPQHRLFLELWKWIGPNRADSLLSVIPRDKLKLVNLYFEEMGQWTLVNLGELDRYRNLTKQELKAIDTTVDAKTAKELKNRVSGMDSTILQRRFLKFCMVLFETKTVPLSEAELKTAIQEKKEEAQNTPSKDVTVVKTVSDLGQKNAAQTQTTEETIPQEEIFNSKANEPSSDHFDEALDKKINDELEALDKLVRERDVSDVETPDENAPDLFVSTESENLEDGVKSVCDAMAERGLMSAAEYKRHLTLSQTYKTLKAPNGKPLSEFIKVPFKELEMKGAAGIPDIETVPDKSMLKSSLLEFDKRYITEVMERDIVGCALNIQKAGISVTDFSIDEVEDVMGGYKAYTMKIVPVEGAPSPVRFRIPVVNEDGIYTANGVNYRLRKQHGDLPIRKVAPDRVALTSYYGKVFVSRCSKRVYDYGHWLRSEIALINFETENKLITEMTPGNVFNHKLKAPRVYGDLSMGFISFKCTPSQYFEDMGPLSYDFIFDRKQIEALVGKDKLPQYEENGAIVVGRASNGLNVIMDMNNVVYLVDEKKTDFSRFRELGTFEKLLNLDTFKLPKEFAELRVLGKNIPLGLVLGHEMGLNKLIKSLKVKYRRIPSGTRMNLQPYEYPIQFDDETLIFSQEDKFAMMIMAGFLDYRDAIKQYSLYDFDKKDVYLNILETKKINLRYLREIDLMYQLFIDPITKEILIEMKESTSFRGLLIRSCELLMTNDHPAEMDTAFMRMKGYERFAGVVYGELIKAIRIHRSRIDRARTPVEVNPHSVWMTISQDPSKILVNEINPIQNLKEAEAVTFGGTGGRSSRSMVKGTRAFHDNSMGVISEATSDSADVGINTYLSANPKFTSLRGLTNRYTPETDGPTSLLSTSALLAPGSDRDDYNGLLK